MHIKYIVKIVPGNHLVFLCCISPISLLNTAGQFPNNKYKAVFELSIKITKLRRLYEAHSQVKLRRILFIRVG